MTFFRLVAGGSRVSFAYADGANFDLIFALLRIGTHHQVINIEGIIKGIIKGILKGSLNGITKSFFTGILKSIFEGILKRITTGFFKGIYEGKELEPEGRAALVGLCWTCRSKAAMCWSASPWPA